MIEKVIILGQSLENENDRLCVVKSGSYERNSSGILKALQDGLFDKYGDFPPEFKMLALVPKGRVSKGEQFAAVVNLMNDDGRTVESVYTITVTFVDNTIKENVHEFTGRKNQRGSEARSY